MRIERVIYPVLFLALLVLAATQRLEIPGLVDRTELVADRQLRSNPSISAINTSNISYSAAELTDPACSTMTEIGPFYVGDNFRAGVVQVNMRASAPTDTYLIAKIEYQFGWGDNQSGFGGILWEDDWRAWYTIDDTSAAGHCKPFDALEWDLITLGPNDSLATYIQFRATWPDSGFLVDSLSYRKGHRNARDARLKIAVTGQLD